LRSGPRPVCHRPFAIGAHHANAGSSARAAATSFMPTSCCRRGTSAPSGNRGRLTRDIPEGRSGRPRQHLPGHGAGISAVTSLRFAARATTCPICHRPFAIGYSLRWATRKAGSGFQSRQAVSNTTSKFRRASKHGSRPSDRVAAPYRGHFNASIRGIRDRGALAALKPKIRPKRVKEWFGQCWFGWLNCYCYDAGRSLPDSSTRESSGNSVHGRGLLNGCEEYSA
jgi:hypothetical protein